MKNLSYGNGFSFALIRNYAVDCRKTILPYRYSRMTCLDFGMRRWTNLAFRTYCQNSGYGFTIYLHLDIFLLKLVNKMPKGIRIFVLIFGKIFVLFFLRWALGYLFIDELQAAPAQFYPGGVGGMSGAGGGSSGGSGWTSFDLGVLDDSDGEEVAQPNPQNMAANPVAAIPPEPNIDYVKEVIKRRLTIHRLGRRPSLVSDDEIDKIFDLKDQIVRRMGELDPNPFWPNMRMVLIERYILPPRGGEYTIPVLERKLQELFSNNPSSLHIYRELLRAKEDLSL